MLLLYKDVKIIIIKITIPTGHTTGMDVLWAGTPMVTLPGRPIFTMDFVYSVDLSYTNYQFLLFRRNPGFSRRCLTAHYIRLP